MRDGSTKVRGRGVVAVARRAAATLRDVRHRFGRLLQLAGLSVTGYVVVVSFGGDIGEKDMFAYGFGGFAIFWIGTMILKRGG
jgi:hypothetical protein